MFTRLITANNSFPKNFKPRQGKLKCLKINKISMDVKLLVLTICKLGQGVLQNGSLKN